MGTSCNKLLHVETKPEYHSTTPPGARGSTIVIAFDIVDHGKTSWKLVLAGAINQGSLQIFRSQGHSSRHEPNFKEAGEDTATEEGKIETRVHPQ